MGGMSTPPRGRTASRAAFRRTRIESRPSELVMKGRSGGWTGCRSRSGWIDRAGTNCEGDGVRSSRPCAQRSGQARSPGLPEGVRTLVTGGSSGRVGTAAADVEADGGESCMRRSEGKEREPPRAHDRDHFLTFELQPQLCFFRTLAHLRLALPRTTFSRAPEAIQTRPGSLPSGSLQHEGR